MSTCPMDWSDGISSRRSILVNQGFVHDLHTSQEKTYESSSRFGPSRNIMHEANEMGIFKYLHNTYGFTGQEHLYGLPNFDMADLETNISTAHQPNHGVHYKIRNRRSRLIFGTFFS